MNILTSARFQQFLSAEGATMSASDIDVVIPVAEARLNSMCRRNFSLHRENETIEVASWDTRKYSIKTKNYPVVADTVLLTRTATAILNTALIIDETSGVIKIRSDTSYFDTGRDAILLSYQCGYSEATAPEDLKYLIYKVAYLIKSMPGVAYQAEAAGDYSYKASNDMFVQGLDPVALAILDRYKKVF